MVQSHPDFSPSRSRSRARRHDLVEEHPEGKVLWHGWLEKGKSAASPLANAAI